MMEVYPCGTKVALLQSGKLTDICGVIVQISIKGNQATYEIAYLLDGKRESDWFNEFEFFTHPEIERSKIGYIK